MIFKSVISISIGVVNVDVITGVPVDEMATGTLGLSNAKQSDVVNENTADHGPLPQLLNALTLQLISANARQGFCADAFEVPLDEVGT